MRSKTIFHLLIFFICAFSLPSSAAIGIFNSRIQSTDGQFPLLVEYRLNCPGTVSIEIIDENKAVIQTLGPWSETAGLHTHSCDPTGIVAGNHSYSARISATAQETGTPGTLKRLAGETGIGFIYGLAVDRCPTSPGYGTIYVSRTSRGGAIRAFYADGTPKNDFGPDGNTNALCLDFDCAIDNAPWGIDVDDLGNIYAACRAGDNVMGVKVYDYQGNLLYHVFPAEPQGNFWLAGLAGDNGLEVFETLGSSLRRSSLVSPAWSEVVGFPTAIIPKQLCFEPGGKAFYLATSGYVSSTANPGIRRYVKQTNGAWQPDTSFSSGLAGLVVNGQTAERYATGVSCDSVDPDGVGPRATSRLWIGLDASSLRFGGNVIRKMLPDGPLQLFVGPSKTSRIIAADAVGNLVMEYDVAGAMYTWNNWGIYSPAGECSSDCRTTGAVAIGDVPTVVQVSLICDMRRLPDGTRVELSSRKTVTAVFADSFYIQESDRSCGIRVDGSMGVPEGAALKLRGTLFTERGERVVKETEIIP